MVVVAEEKVGAGCRFSSKTWLDGDQAKYTFTTGEGLDTRKTQDSHALTQATF